VATGLGGVTGSRDGSPLDAAVEESMGAGCRILESALAEWQVGGLGWYCLVLLPMPSGPVQLAFTAAGLKNGEG
jgi:hypothetical protein